MTRTLLGPIASKIRVRVDLSGARAAGGRPSDAVAALDHVTRLIGKECRPRAIAVHPGKPAVSARPAWWKIYSDPDFHRFL